MHVVFVSYCEKRAIKRTRAILDSYARRTGDRTWLTPITQQGLIELHKYLRKSATRQTSVACFRNDGMKRMRLIWIVGNSKNFDHNGISPVATTQKKRSVVMPAWARLCALIAETAGFMHDLGKFNQEFQDKLLKKGPVKDNVRHEWLSMFLANKLIANKSWVEAVNLTVNNPKKFSDKGHRFDTLIFANHLTSIMDVLLYCIATHHKLPCKISDNVSNEHHVNFKNRENPIFNNPAIPFSPSEKLIGLIGRNIKKLQQIQTHTNDKTYWRAIATISRMALILADQSISAKPHPAETTTDSNTEIAYANTHGKDRKLNQDLSWHLENVGLKANQMLFDMLNIPLPCLSQDAIYQICIPATGRYEWQNKAALALSISQKKFDIPHLLLNIAGTGSGKTRMNLRAICVLSEDKPTRVATALNLRTLTLQTGDAFHHQIGIELDEMACVIGDSLSQKLHESKNANVDEDESEDSIDVSSDFDFNAPQWLKFYSDKNAKLGDVIGAPLLVSTIDFLIAAGEPHRKHHHILASMRVMHSDLILDEIDGYEPKALLSVLRLVTMSAMYGKNVIASSATLSKPVAKMLWQAYQHGANMRGLLNNESVQFRSAIIDDLIKPSIGFHSDADEFMLTYVQHVESLMDTLKDKRYRVPILAEIPNKNREGWFMAIERQVIDLHNHHSWSDDKTGKKISFGLVRIANVNRAVEVARHLSKSVKGVKIVCYHANHFPMQRFHIERCLDFLLTRKGKYPNQHILHDQEIREILNQSEGDVQFIVVATPVEEIGRDHDFDWAVIEPSSSQSIVQTSGRVNRHRLVDVVKPNIAILQYCYREVVGQNLVFVKPGLEQMLSINTCEQRSHCSHDIKDLFQWDGLEQVDSRMRFNSEIHSFAKYDDIAIEDQTKDIFKSMLTEDNLWMAKETYTQSSLRSLEPTVELKLINPEDTNKYSVSSRDDDGKEEIAIIDSHPPVPNDWLIKTDDELINEAKELNIFDERTMTVSVSFYGKDQKPSLFVKEKVCRHESFGFYIKS